MSEEPEGPKDGEVVGRITLRDATIEQLNAFCAGRVMFGTYRPATVSALVYAAGELAPHDDVEVVATHDARRGKAHLMLRSARVDTRRLYLRSLA